MSKASQIAGSLKVSVNERSPSQGSSNSQSPDKYTKIVSFTNYPKHQVSISPMDTMREIAGDLTPQPKINFLPGTSVQQQRVQIKGLGSDVHTPMTDKNGGATSDRVETESALLVNYLQPLSQQSQSQRIQNKKQQRKGLSSKDLITSTSQSPRKPIRNNEIKSDLTLTPIEVDLQEQIHLTSRWNGSQKDDLNNSSLRRMKLNTVDKKQTNLFRNKTFYKDPRNRFNCQIRYNSRFRMYWDVMIIVFSLWNCFTLPVDIAFSPLAFQSYGNVILNYMMDFLFAMDVVLNFRTSIANDLTGEEIFDSKLIAMRYLKNRFFLDILSSVPLDTFVSLFSTNRNGVSKNLSLLSMLKIIRILRFTRIISYLNTTQDVKLSLKLVKLIFYLIIYLHWQACGWFFYTKMDKSWYPLPDIVKEQYHFYDESFLFTYCFSLWHSVSILDGDDMVPATWHQALVVSFLVIVSEFIHAHILGTIGVVVHSMSRKQQRFQEQVEFVTSTMKTIKLNEGIQHKILEYLGKKYNEFDSLKDLENLMTMLSPTLRHLVTQHLFLKAISKIHYFIENQDIVEFILSNVEAVQFLPDDYIIRQGQKATHVYILAQGQCEVLVKDQFKKETFIREISPGMIFGEVALLFGTKRTASIRSKDQCTVGALTEEIFEEMLQNFPEIENSLRLDSRNYNDHWKQYQIDIITKVEYLKNLSYEVREDLHYKLTLENFEKGSKIIHRGSDCQQIIFVVNGELELYVDQNNVDYTLDVLGMGSVVGSFSIINQSQYQYNGKAKTNLSVLILKRDDLLEAAEDYADLTESIEKATQFILDNEVPLCDYNMVITGWQSLLSSKRVSLNMAKKKYSSMHGDIQIAQSILEKFRNAVRKVKVLNRRRELKVYKLYELINNISQAKKRISAIKSNELQQQNSIITPVNRQQQVASLALKGKRRSSIAFTGQFLPKVEAINNKLLQQRQSQKFQVQLVLSSQEAIDQTDSNRVSFSLLDQSPLPHNGQPTNAQVQFEIVKMNRRLETIVTMIQTLQQDMNHVKDQMKQSGAGNDSSPLNHPQPLSPKQLKIPSIMMGSMTGILEDEREETSQNSSSQPSTSRRDSKSIQKQQSVDRASSIAKQRTYQTQQSRQSVETQPQKRLSEAPQLKNSESLKQSEKSLPRPSITNMGDKIGTMRPSIMDVVKQLQKQIPSNQIHPQENVEREKYQQAEQVTLQEFPQPQPQTNQLNPKTSQTLQQQDNQMTSKNLNPRYVQKVMTLIKSKQSQNQLHTLSTSPEAQFTQNPHDFTSTLSANNMNTTVMMPKIGIQEQQQQHLGVSKSRGITPHESVIPDIPYLKNIQSFNQANTPHNFKQLESADTSGLKDVSSIDIMLKNETPNTAITQIIDTPDIGSDELQMRTQNYQIPNSSLTPSQQQYSSLLQNNTKQPTNFFRISNFAAADTRAGGYHRMTQSPRGNATPSVVSNNTSQLNPGQIYITLNSSINATNGCITPPVPYIGSLGQKDRNSMGPTVHHRPKENLTKNNPVIAYKEEVHDYQSANALNIPEVHNDGDSFESNSAKSAQFHISANQTSIRQNPLYEKQPSSKKAQSTTLLNFENNFGGDADSSKKGLYVATSRNYQYNNIKSSENNEDDIEDGYGGGVDQIINEEIDRMRKDEAKAMTRNRDSSENRARSGTSSGPPGELGGTKFT